MSQFIIVFPRGDREKLSVVEIVQGLEYEIQDYAVASREQFYDRKEAIEYARDLARQHKLVLLGDQESSYLD